MTHFNEAFYTKDYDQEMLDFVKGKYELDQQEGNVIYLKYGTGNDCFWISDNVYNRCGTLLTKQQFKEKIGMVDKVFNGVDSSGNKLNFTKDDLKDGMVVETRGRERYFVLGDTFLNGGGFQRVNEFNEQLLLLAEDQDEFDIVKVFTVREVFNISKLLEFSSHTLVWERVEETKEETPRKEKLAELQESIKIAQESILKAQEQIEGLG